MAKKKYHRCAKAVALAKAEIQKQQTKKKLDSGGNEIQGLLRCAERVISQGGQFLKEASTWMAIVTAKAGFIIATTSMVVIMPLLLEIGRDTQMMTVQVKALRNQGFSEGQLRQLGYATIPWKGQTQ